MNGGLKKLNNIIKAGMAMFALKKTLGKEWDDDFTTKASRKLDSENDWVIDSGCACHMTGDVEKLQNLSKYEGHQTTITPDHLESPIAHVGSTVVPFKYSNDNLPLQKVYHVPGMKANLISVAELTSSGYFVLFGPQDVKLYRGLEISGEPVLKGQMVKSVYVFRGD